MADEQLIKLRETETSALKQQRSPVRSSATNNLKKIDQLGDLSSKSEISYRSLVKNLKDIRSRLQELNSKIQIGLNSEELGGDVQRSFEYDEKLGDAVNLLESRLEVFESEKRIQHLAAASRGGGSAQSKTARYPKLELTTFGGDPLEWESFWDDFSSSVDQRPELTVIDKFKILKKSLTDEALKVANGYLLTEKNYQQVKENLQEWFGDPEVAIFAHFEALLALSSANHDIDQLRSVYEACESHIRSLVALGLSEDTFGLVFTPLILSKLPKFVKIELHRKNGRQKWTLANLRELLKDEIKARDKGERSFASSSSKSTPKGGKAGKSGGTAGSLFTDSGKPGKKQSAKQGTSKSCAFCGGLHPSWKCRKYPDCDSRRAQAKGKCSCCLEAGHVSKTCPNKSPCFYCAKDNHHSSLCFQKFGTPAGKSGGSDSAAKQDDVGSAESSVFVSTLNPDAHEFSPKSPDTAAVASSSPGMRSGTAVVKAARVQVVGQKSSAVAQLVFDDCSTTSFISNSLANKIGAKLLGVEYRSVGHFGSNKRKSLKWCSYEVSVRASNGRLRSLVLNGVDTICPPIRLAPLSEAASPIIHSLELAQPLVDSVVSANVDILLGLDYYNDFILDDEFRVNGLIFRKSIFGFLASGFLSSPPGSTTTDDGNQLFISSVPESANYDIERMWRDEDWGIKDDPNETIDDEQVFRDFEKTIDRSSDGRYLVRWPFRVPNPEISDTYNLSLARLRVLISRKLSGDDASFESYEQTLADQLDRGIIEEAPSKPQGKTYYMPHHAVVKPDRVTTKLRIVFDASAKAGKHEFSLNECLHRGPLILEDLVGLICRFRFHAVAFTADIEKAFHMVGIQEDERDVTRFLWVRDKSKPVTADNVLIYRFARVPFGCVSSSFLLSGTIVHHLRQSGSEMASEILSFMYVDNIIGGRSTPSSALQFYTATKDLFQQASMNVRQWYTNNTDLRAELPYDDQAQGDDTSILGVIWTFSSDALSCKAGPFLHTQGRSKRQILKGLASFYDPCGWFSPVSISARILMQKIWISGVSWDETLSPEFCSAWLQVQSDLFLALEVRIPRYLVGFPVLPDKNSVQLHAFVDASGKAHSTAIFIRYVEKDRGTVRVQLVFSRARVAPAKPTTIPRLELMAAVLGARLVAALRDHLKIPDVDTFLWSDSTCVIAWLSRTTACTAYVARRVDLIKKTNPSYIRYVPSSENPADINSRGLSTEKLMESDLWWYGPPWLPGSIETWPSFPASQYNPTAGPSEPEKSNTGEDNSTDLVNTVISQSEPIIDLKRFSSLSKLLRVTAYVFRAFSKNRPSSVTVTSAELTRAQSFWDKNVQQIAFFSDDTLKPYKDLRPYRDDQNVIRCKGRFINSDLPVDAQDPILLPRSSEYTRLLIKHFHQMSFHAGAKHTLARFRQRYWTSAGLSTVKPVLYQCLICRRVDGGHYKLPAVAPLPAFRTRVERPFTSAGLDYLGPLLVKQDGGSRKAWVCLFTCAVTRAIHLEVALSLSSLDFLLALRRFVACHGAPNILVSDNAKQFTAVEKALRKEWYQVTHDAEVQKYAAKQGVQWAFIPELSPWMGGFYERLVKPVKAALKKSLGKQLVSSEELATLLYEIASVINSRPLTYVGGEFEKHYLCPLDFIRHGGTFLYADGPDQDWDAVPAGTRSSDIVQNFREGQRILNHFWSVWFQSYLTSLREAHHDAKQRNVVGDAAQVGHCVIIKDQLQPRAQWKVGRISKLFRSRDGEVRSAEVTLANKRTLRRPLKLLFPLEMSGATDNDPPHPATAPPGRPPRQAAIRARAAIGHVLSDEEQSDSEQ